MESASPFFRNSRSSIFSSKDKHIDSYFQNICIHASNLNLTYLVINLSRQENALLSFDPALTKMFGASGITAINNGFWEKRLPLKDQHRFSRIISFINNMYQRDMNEATKCAYFTFTIPFEINKIAQSITFHSMPLLYIQTDGGESPLFILHQLMPAKNLSRLLSLHVINADETSYYSFNENEEQINLIVKLTKTEMNIIQLTYKGYTEAEIATILSMTSGMVKYCKSNLLSKTKSHSMAQTIANLHHQHIL